MSCTRKQTCSRCDGEGRITVYTESSSEHKVGVWFHGHEYERPTKQITCPTCNGRGKEIVPDHDFNYQEAMEKDWYHARCKKCGKYSNQV